MLITIWPIPILHPSPRLTSRCQRYLQISNVRMQITKFWVLTKYTNGLVIARNAFGLVLRKVQNYANRCKRSDNSVKYVIMHWWKSDDCTMNVSWGESDDCTMNVSRGENQSHLFFSRPFPPVRLPLVTHLMPNVFYPVLSMNDWHDWVSSAKENRTPKVRRASMSPGIW